MAKESYFEQVYDVVRLVPYGRVTTYGTIAGFLGLGSARMVGWALNHSFTSEGVPAHRVVNRNGELTGRNHFPTPTMMQELLEREGIDIVDNTVQDFEKIYWNPDMEVDE